MKKANTTLIFISLIILCLLSCGDILGTKSGSDSKGEGGGEGPPNKWEIDSDNDGYNDYVEEYMGYDPYSADSVPEGAIGDDGLIDFSQDSDVPTLDDLNNDPDKKDILDSLMQIAQFGGTGLSLLGLGNAGLGKVGVCVLPTSKGKPDPNTMEEIQGNPLGTPFTGTGGLITFEGNQYGMIGVETSGGTFVAGFGYLYLKPANYFGCIEVYSLNTCKQCAADGAFVSMTPKSPGYIVNIIISGANARTKIITAGTYIRAMTACNNETKTDNPACVQ